MLVVFCMAACGVVGRRRGYRGGRPTAVQAWQPCPLGAIPQSPHIIVD